MVILYTDLSETMEYAVSELIHYTVRISGNTILPVSRHVTSFDGNDTCKTVKLGLLSELGLSEKGVRDPFVDDIIDINMNGESGYIAGSNIRSVLLGVYRYLRSLGARWVRPGIDGEYIPLADIGSHSFAYRHEASYRYRGECIEGAVSYENVRDTIIWSPRVGLNMFFMEQIVPYNYISRWYNREYNPDKPNDPRTFECVGKYTEKLELLIKKCGLQLHSMGHGYMFETYGIHYKTWADKYELTDLARSHCAMVNGKRELFHGSPNFTQLCYSNPDARRGMVEFCCSYLEKKPYIDFLHVWLADANNNHCECENCRKKTPSDFYVMFLNELCAELTKRSIETRIVFILYNDTVFPPETEKLSVNNRFVLLTAFSRDYSIPYTDEKFDGELPEFKRNNFNIPSDFNIKYAFCQKWREQFKGDAFLYEYYFYTDHYNDPGYTALPKILAEDAEKLGELGFDGIVSDQTQRSFFPNGLPMASMSEGLYDKNFDKDMFADDYFKAAYGTDWTAAKTYLTSISEMFDPPLLRTKHSIVEQDTGMYRSKDVYQWRDNPEFSEKLSAVPKAADEIQPIIERNMLSDDPCRMKSWRYLKLHSKYAVQYASALKAGADGNMEKARELYSELKDMLKSDEDEWQPDFDLCLFIQNSSAKFR